MLQNFRVGFYTWLFTVILIVAVTGAEWLKRGAFLHGLSVKDMPLPLFDIPVFWMWSYGFFHGLGVAAIASLVVVFIIFLVSLYTKK